MGMSGKDLITIGVGLAVLWFLMLGSLYDIAGKVYNNSELTEGAKSLFVSAVLSTLAFVMAAVVR